jgi:hypothetical protein
VNPFGRMCGTIDPESCIRRVLGFGVKTGYDNTNGQEFVKFTEGNSHQAKQDNKASNHVSNIDANSSYMPYHDFDASYILMKNKHGKVIALYVGPHHKRPKTCVRVPKVLVTNVKGPKQVWVPKTKA